MFIEVCRNEVHGAGAHAGQKQEYTKSNACDLLKLCWTGSLTAAISRKHTQSQHSQPLFQKCRVLTENKVCRATSILPALLLCGSSAVSFFSASRREVSMDIPQANLHSPQSIQKTWNKRQVLRRKTTKIALEKVASWKWGKFTFHCTDVPLLWRMKIKQNAIVERTAILTFLLLLDCLSNLLVFSNPSTLLSAL